MHGRGYNINKQKGHEYNHYYLFMHNVGVLFACDPLDIATFTAFLGCPMRNMVRSTGHFGPSLFAAHTGTLLADLRIIVYELETDI